MGVKNALLKGIKSATKWIAKNPDAVAKAAEKLIPDDKDKKNEKKKKK